MKRRKFMGQGSLALASLMLMRCKAEQNKKKIEESTGKKLGDFGLQLWSVRALMDEDVIGTLKSLSEIGYKEIEGMGGAYADGKLHGFELKEFKSIIGDLGLKLSSTHTPGTGRNSEKDTVNMTHNWERYCNDMAELGVETVILAWLDEGQRESLDDFKYTTDLLNDCAVTANKYGMSMAYHNHDFEFYPIDDQVPYDLMLNMTDPEHVNFEMDHYWVEYGGANSLEYFKNYPGRFHYWHVKDMANTEDRFYTPVGKGIIDYVEIFKNEELSGMKKFFVEQDDFRDYEPLAGMEISYDYLRNMVY
ncbi:MAG: sugar phosphate isomerase/epimerase family protein [Saprospiraceae bacterium]|jgi:sugar phosphate isomerase/epimerase